MTMPNIPYSYARKFGLVVRNADAGARCFHRSDVNHHALAEVCRLYGTDLPFETVLPEQFEHLLAEVYRDNASDASAAAGADEDLARIVDAVSEVDDLLDQSDDAPVIRLINAILLEAIRETASDIHIEPSEKRLAVRFRIDGMMRLMIEPRRALAPMIISRIKVMARLDIAERRMPQDGRVSLRVGGHEVDVRVSTIPCQHGERAVLRLLDRGTTRLGLGHLGMGDVHAERFGQLLARPDGLLLVTGPTGSGKTTTLYAALDHLNDQSRNIMTVEDPIEYTLEGIGQMQVNAKADLSFAKGLRAILRQDPDVIMVGEIRDRETAQTAVEAAMTGHFVLSTLHTNTAIGAIARLVDMGVERFLLAPMLRGAVAQRLVRRLCPECRVPMAHDPADASALPTLAAGTRVFQPQGCPACHNSGYRGRAAMYEICVITPELERMIQAGASEADLTATARHDSPGLWEDGVRLVREGVTSVQEVMRVVQET